jgi:hypothetical protein
MRPVDHLVLPVTTLTLARSRLTGLGFTVAPDARHPFGTGNCCVFFKNLTYLEPITILDRNLADMAAAEGGFFVKRLKRYTERQGEGFAMAALKGDDANGDRARFEAAGLSGGPVFRFSRMAAQADGSETEIGVALAYADHPSAPDATLFTCQHLAPDVLFQPPFLEHSNGALGITSVAAVAESPAEYGSFLGAVTSAEVTESPSEVKANGSGQSVSVLTPSAFSERYGIAAPDPRRGLLLTGFDIAVEDLDRAIGFAGPTAQRCGDRVVVPAGPGLGAVLAFRMQDHG